MYIVGARTDQEIVIYIFTTTVDLLSEFASGREEEQKEQSKKSARMKIESKERKIYTNASLHIY